MNNYAKHFPLLSQTLDGMPITYLDAASTTPKPQSVIDAVTHYYTHLGANVHRGVHPFSEGTTQAYEQTRYALAALIGASPSEIIFTRNATESINLISHCLGLAKTDEIIIPASEHHSNMLPWQAHATTRLINVDESGMADWLSIKDYISPKTKLIAVGHVSNVTGMIAPIEKMAAIAQAHGIPILVDASQSISHLPINVKEIGCDFMAFSSHKMFGPSGVGILYVNQDKFDLLSLFNVGGGMVLSTEDDHFVPLDAPFAYEAGTPNIEGVIGLYEAINFINSIGFDTITAHSQMIGDYCHHALGELPGIKILGGQVPASERIAICSFALPELSLTHTHIAQMLANSQSILLSAGTHCAHVLHRQIDLPGTIRISAHLYNDTQDIDKVVSALAQIMMKNQ